MRSQPLSMATPSILFIVRDPLPPIRADVLTLFGTEMPRYGLATSLVGQGGSGTSPPPSSGGTAPNSTVQKYLQQAETFYNQAQEALKSGNLAEFGADLAKMKAALDKAQKAAQGSPSPRPSASPSPSASP